MTERLSVPIIYLISFDFRNLLSFMPLRSGVSLKTEY